MSLADGGVQGRDVRVPEVFRQRQQRVATEQALQRQTLLAHHPADGVLALFDRVFAALAGEPLPDLVTRTR